MLADDDGAFHKGARLDDRVGADPDPVVGEVGPGQDDRGSLQQDAVSKGLERALGAGGLDLSVLPCFSFEDHQGPLYLPCDAREPGAFLEQGRKVVLQPVEGRPDERLLRKDLAVLELLQDEELLRLQHGSILRFHSFVRSGIVPAPQSLFAATPSWPAPPCGAGGPPSSGLWRPRAGNGIVWACPRSG